MFPLGLIRTIAGIFCIVTSWVTVFGIAIYFSAFGLNWMVEWVSPVWNDLAWNWNDFEPLNIVELPISDDFLVNIDMPLFYSMALVMVVLMLSFLSYWIRPILHDIRGIGQLNKVGKDTDLYEMVKVLADKSNMRTPRVYVVEMGDAPNAFALSKPFRSAIVFTSSMVMQDPKQLAWVIAHELGHIHAGDSDSAGLWLSITQTEDMMNTWRYWIIRAMIPVIVRLPIMNLFIRPILWILKLLIGISNQAAKLAHYGFKIVDRSLQREMELRADAFACKITCPEYGLDALHTLGNYEPTFNLFGTHPATSVRIKAMEKLKKES